MRILIKNGLVFLESKGKGAMEPHRLDVKIDGGTIIEMGENLNNELYPVIDAEGHYILPGFIDMNCDLCDPGYESKEDIFSVSHAAAKGGFTTITCQPCTYPVIDNKTVVNYIISKSKSQSTVNTYIYGSMTVGCKGGEMADIGEMARAGIIGLSDGGNAISDPLLMRNVLMYAKMFNMPVITKCDDRRISEEGVINNGKVSTITGLKGIPREAEEIMVARNLVLVGHTGGHLHITSVSTKGSVELIRYAKKRGANVTCETHPHYIGLTEDSVSSYNTYAKLNPPLRTAEDIKSIKEGLADGTIDVISSGHAPDTIESKQCEFDKASYGISSLESAYAVCYKNLVETGDLSYYQMIEKLTANPAKILGLGTKGAIKPGLDGDVVIINKDQSYTINPEHFASKAKYSPFKSETVKGRILYTIVGGEMVYLS